MKSCNGCKAVGNGLANKIKGWQYIFSISNAYDVMFIKGIMSGFIFQIHLRSLFLRRAISYKEAEPSGNFQIFVFLQHVIAGKSRVMCSSQTITATPAARQLPVPEAIAVPGLTKPIAEAAAILVMIHRAVRERSSFFSFLSNVS